MNTINLLHTFVSQRPGFEFADYGSRPAYFADVRKVTRQLHDARELMAFCARHNIDPAAQLTNTGGRLFIENDKLTYHVGMYWPTEYRAAVCRVLAESIWHWLRDDGGYNTGDDIRKAARRLLGRGISARWFN